MSDETKPSAHDDLFTLTDDTITNEQIDDMKMLGMPKPETISWPRWMGPRDITHRHDLIIHLAAMGKSNREIARAIDADDGRVSIILNTPIIKRAIKDKQLEYYGSDAKAYLKSLTTKSFEVIDSILTDPNEKAATRLDAAKYTMDHNAGKATQSVKVEGNVLHEIISKLDEREKQARIVDNPLDIKAIEAPVDPLDNFVDTITRDVSVIGKRGES